MSITFRTLQAAGYVFAFALGTLIAAPAFAHAKTAPAACHTATQASAAANFTTQAVEPWYIRGGP